MLIEFNKITTLNDSNNYFTNKLPLRHSYVFKGQTSSYYISGHHYTVTRRIVSMHLQVIKDQDVCLF